MRQNGQPLGPLHGIPVGIKDIFDTSDMPTEDGTVLHAGRNPRDDCAVVALLRQAGAVIMGKTTTTELAMYTPSKTRNPHRTRANTIPAAAKSALDLHLSTPELVTTTHRPGASHPPN